MAFEKFTQTTSRFNSKISFWKGGQIGFSQGAVKRLDLKLFSHAVLFFDKENYLVGIKFTTDATENGAIKISARGKGAFVPAKAFMDFYEITYPRDTRYDINYDEETDLFIIDLRQQEN